MKPEHLKRLVACACQHVGEQYRRSLIEDSPAGVLRSSHCQSEYDAWQTLEAAAAAAHEVWQQCEGT